MEVRDLEGVPLFRDLSNRERRQVAAWADVVDAPSGYLLVEEGRIPHEFFVILEGSASVDHEGNHLTDLGPGDFFGEIALLESGRRTATVSATTPIRAIVMHQSNFDAMRRVLPVVAERVHSVIAERMGRALRDAPDAGSDSPNR